MGLFDKKKCDVCGSSIGILGSRKIKDGVICRSCQKKLSPWFEERKETDLEGIREQLRQREKNKEYVANFNPTYEYDTKAYYMRVLMDEENRTFMITDCFDDDMEEENPDVFSLDEVVECNLDVEEEEEELMDEDDEGNSRHFKPPHYERTYNFHFQVVLDHPYLDEVCFDLNEDDVVVEDLGEKDFDPENDPEYAKYMEMADEIMTVLTEDYEDEDEEEEVEVFEDEDGKEIKVVRCPWCGAKARVTYTGRCEYCGGDLEA